MHWTRITLGLATLVAARASPTTVTGKKVSWLGVRNETAALDYFLGVPFAQPPVGPLRFKPPLPLAKPTSPTTVNATVPGNACEQANSPEPTVPTSEDCLVLNICMYRHDSGRHKLKLECSETHQYYREAACDGIYL